METHMRRICRLVLTYGYILVSSASGFPEVFVPLMFMWWTYIQTPFQGCNRIKSSNSMSVTRKASTWRPALSIDDTLRLWCYLPTMLWERRQRRLRNNWRLTCPKSGTRHIWRHVGMSVIACPWTLYGPLSCFYGGQGAAGPIRSDKCLNKR